MATIQLKFKTIYEDINSRIFFYDTSLTIKEMLLDFLDKTNSKKILNPDDISFLFKSIIINKKDSINKKVGDIFNSLIFLNFLNS